MATDPELSQTPITKAAFEQSSRGPECNCVWFDDGCEHLITCPRHPTKLSESAEEPDGGYSRCA